MCVAFACLFCLFIRVVVRLLVGRLYCCVWHVCFVVCLLACLACDTFACLFGYAVDCLFV